MIIRTYDKPRTIATLLLALTITLVGCGQAATPDTPSTASPSSSPSSSTASPSTSPSPSEAAPTTDTTSSEEAPASSDASAASNSSVEASGSLTVRFGDDGAPFTMHLYDNDTATAIARHVGTAAWRLPIYSFDNFDNWEVMQYYDIPSRYEIPSAPEAVTTEKLGEVYYSDPNRIVLFYGDAQVSGEYTKIGYFDATDEFVAAVSGNPVLEGWGNKIVHIGAAQ